MEDDARALRLQLIESQVLFQEAMTQARELLLTTIDSELEGMDSDEEYESEEESDVEAAAAEAAERAAAKDGLSAQFDSMLRVLDQLEQDATAEQESIAAAQASSGPAAPLRVAEMLSSRTKGGGAARSGAARSRAAREGSVRNGAAPSASGSGREAAAEQVARTESNGSQSDAKAYDWTVQAPAEPAAVAEAAPVEAPLDDTRGWGWPGKPPADYGANSKPAALAAEEQPASEDSWSWPTVKPRTSFWESGDQQ